MLFLSPWFYAVLAIMIVMVRLVPSALRPWTIVVWSGAMLAWQLPETLAAVAGSAVVVWAMCRWVAAAGARARVVANVCSCAVVAGVVGLRVWGPLFGGLTISVDATLSEAAKLIGVAYLALKLHHAIRFTLFDREQRPRLLSMLGYTLYLPTLAGGPVLRLREWYALEREDVHADAGAAIDVGVRRMAWGLGKKVLVVPLLVWASGILMRQDAWWGIPALLVASLLLVYADFSGYSDIALGSARTLGHRVRENFHAPFTATSLSHFWRGWHMSMGDWLREHIFIPLGGMRAGRSKIMVITFATMLFCGLWHAFEWRFVAWGVYHGLLLAAEAGLGIKPLPPNAPRGKVWLRRSAIFVVMCGSSAFFIPMWWD